MSVRVCMCSCVCARARLFPSSSSLLSGLVVPTLMASLLAVPSAHPGKVKGIETGALSVSVIRLALSFSTLAVRIDIKNKKMDGMWVRTRGMFYSKWKRVQIQFVRAIVKELGRFWRNGGCLCTDLGFTSLRVHIISRLRCFLRERSIFSPPYSNNKQKGEQCRWSLFIQATW